MRRLVGYDRFEGRNGWEALAQLYQVLRKYVNYFQPSLKLLAKERKGAKVSKKYDLEKTPFQRALLSDHVCPATKESIAAEYETLDPVELLKELTVLQDNLWKYSWSKSGHAKDSFLVTQDVAVDANKTPAVNSDRFYRSSKKVDLRSSPRTESGHNN